MFHFRQRNGLDVGLFGMVVKIVLMIALSGEK